MPAFYSPFESPLRYPGGKGKVATFVRILLRRNRLSGGEYAEPYAGGAGIALALLYGEFVSRIRINDLDPAVFGFWWSAVNETDGLARRIRDTKVSLREWRRQRRVYEQARDQPGSIAPLDLGFATFFLNRTNRSGIITGGPIGGKVQQSDWRIDARYARADLANRILNVGANAGRIVVTNLDAARFLTDVVPTIPERSLVYLDPPYYEKGASKLYANYYRPNDHALVASLVRAMERPWIVSYDNAPAIAELYRGFRRIRYNLSYSANERRRGGEIMFFADALEVPVLRSPERIPTRRARVIERDRLWRVVGDEARDLTAPRLRPGRQRRPALDAERRRLA